MSFGREENGYFLLLGAGASKPAGIPLVKEFLDYFRKYLKSRSDNVDIKILLTTLEEIVNHWSAENSQRDINLEIFYETLYQINRPFGLINPGQPIESCPKKGTATVFLEAELMGYIRERCLIKNNNKLRYLTPLLDLLEICPTLDIVTLNYDTTIEALCITKNIQWTDGFDSKGNWNPYKFRASRTQKKVRLFKLHGSVAWYQGPHVDLKYKRILESDLREVGRKMGRDFTPTIDALMIYPGIGKQLIFGPYVEMMAYFRKLAFSRKLCIAIGYSFGDPHIKGIILDHLRLNPNLKLVVIDPKARDISINLAVESGLSWRSQERIIPVKMTIQKALQNYYLQEQTKNWLEGKLNIEERKSINLALKKFQTKYQNTHIKKIPDSPDDLWAIAVDYNANLAYLTKFSDGQLLCLNLDSWKWEIVTKGLKRPKGMTIEQGENWLYVVEDEYQLKKDEHLVSEREKRLTRYIQKYEGYGRLWRVSLDLQNYGLRMPITYMGSKDSNSALKPYQPIKSQIIWKKIPGVLRWPEAVIVEEPKKTVLVVESHRLCRIYLESGTIKTAFYIPLCMNLVGIVFEKEDKTNVILLEAGWWELERGRFFSTTGYGRILRVNLKNQEMQTLYTGFTKARGLALMPSRKSILFGQSQPYPYGCIFEVDLTSCDVLRTWSGLDEPRDIAIVPDDSCALVTTRDGLYTLKF